MNTKEYQRQYRPLVNPGFTINTYEMPMQSIVADALEKAVLAIYQLGGWEQLNNRKLLIDLEKQLRILKPHSILFKNDGE